VRLCVVDAPPYVVPDVRGRLGGRGVWVCAKRKCVNQAVYKGGLSRSLRRPVHGVDGAQVMRALADRFRRRAEGLLASAVRTKNVAIGTDATKLAIKNGSAKLLVVAKDAAGRRHELENDSQRLNDGYVAFGTKASLGRLFGR